MNDEDGAQFRFFHKIHAACNSVAMGVSTEHGVLITVSFFAVTSFNLQSFIDDYSFAPDSGYYSVPF